MYIPEDTHRLLSLDINGGLAGQAQRQGWETGRNIPSIWRVKSKTAGMTCIYAGGGGGGNTEQIDSAFIHGKPLLVQAVIHSWKQITG